MTETHVCHNFIVPRVCKISKHQTKIKKSQKFQQASTEFKQRARVCVCVCNKFEIILPKVSTPLNWKSDIFHRITFYKMLVSCDYTVDALKYVECRRQISIHSTKNCPTM